MVAPRLLTVTRGVADLRGEPRDGAELVDQVHYGEILALLGSREAWHYVQGEDHYFGWIHGSHAAAQATSASAARVVAVPLADVRGQPDRSAVVVDRLPAGTWLPLTRRSERAGWLALADGRWIEADDTAPFNDLPRRSPTADDLIRTAEAFLGVPYLWGGTTAHGMDCSGFVQQVYRLNGIRLDRDADQQATEGRAVDVPRAGDLLFFSSSPGDPPSERVTHVALATAERAFLHAPRAGARVERGELPAEGRTLRAVRRYLPPSHGDPP